MISGCVSTQRLEDTLARVHVRRLSQLALFKTVRRLVASAWAGSCLAGQHLLDQATEAAVFVRWTDASGCPGHLLGASLEQSLVGLDLCLITQVAHDADAGPGHARLSHKHTAADSWLEWFLLLTKHASAAEIGARIATRCNEVLAFLSD